MSDTPTESKQEPQDKDLSALASLTDGRVAGDFRSIYPTTAWVQIVLEFVYLVGIQISSLVLLLLLALYALHGHPGEMIFNAIGPYRLNRHIVAYASIGLAGACGGCTFALKWLYHTVAKRQWHRDRVVWRIVVPLSSAFVATFSGLMIISGIVPFLSKAPLMVPTTGAAYGFFVGVFSDNVLAALQNFAFNVFGTVDKNKIQTTPAGFSGEP